MLIKNMTTITAYFASAYEIVFAGLYFIYGLISTFMIYVGTFNPKRDSWRSVACHTAAAQGGKTHPHHHAIFTVIVGLVLYFIIEWKVLAFLFLFFQVISHIQGWVYRLVEAKRCQKKS